MELWQKIAIIIYGLTSIFIFIKGIVEVTKKNNSFREIPLLAFMGIFVWGDAIVFGFFWLLASLISFILNDWLLFLLIFCVFWVVRSLGETMYWFNQQFSQINRNPPQRLRGYRFLKSNSIWFSYQIAWQCISVISIIVTIYIGYLWITKLSLQ